uniref:Protein kintoun n=2 Tax=Camelus bactrianus TaxID=9837 RepID=A0A9W3F5Y1_CAMBA|nr:protein kintoun [Camelus bactrianus]
MAKAAASSPLEDLDLSGEEVQRLTSAFQDPEFRRMFSQYAEELTDPENRRRYEEEITALERERGVEVRFVHPEAGHVLRTSLDGTQRCFVNVCSNALVGAPSSRPGSEGAAPGSQWSLPYSLAPGREYAGGRGTRYTVYDVRAGAADAGITTRDAAGEGIVSEPEERDFGRKARSTTGIGEEPPPGAKSSPGDGGGGSPCTSSGDLDTASSAASESACGAVSVEAAVAREADRAMGGRGTDLGETLCPPLQCNQDEESLTLLIQVPWIQPQSLQGEVTSLWYKLCFSTQDLVYYSFFLQFAPENKLSTKEPVVSISSNNAVIELAKSPECHGHWREWYYGLNNDSLEERLFVNEENVNEFLEEVQSSSSKQTMPLTPPLIEVLQITDSKIEIHAKLQKCSTSEQLHEKEERVSEGHLTGKENLEHPTTSTTDWESSGAAEVPDAARSGSAARLQQGAPDVPQKLPAESQQPESNMEPEFVKERSAVHASEEKNNLKEPVITEEKELDGDHLSSLLNKTAVHNTPGFDNIKETNMQDGSVQIIKDHVTHCSFSFQNSLLYDLD